MQGLEIAREYYTRFGKPMLESAFAGELDRIAVGLVGEGSECLGFDDEISTDHDFEPGFCLFLTRADGEAFGFRLERAYAKLPKEFMGLRRSPLSPVGGNRHGVITVEDFYTRYLGTPSAPVSDRQWLYTPSYGLLAASNGEVFTDPLGAFSQVRQVLQKGYPEDVRRKKLAAHTVLMAQAGQYNYPRLIKRGENGAAQLALTEFVRHAISVIYLLNNRYEPFYKWVYRGMRTFPILGEVEPALAGATELDNTPANVAYKRDIIEDVGAMVIRELHRQGLTDGQGEDLERHAYVVQEGIQSQELRNLHIMEGA